jgi:hypothetical protein
VLSWTLVGRVYQTSFTVCCWVEPRTSLMISSWHSANSSIRSYELASFAMDVVAINLLSLPPNLVPKRQRRSPIRPALPNRRLSVPIVKRSRNRSERLVSAKDVGRKTGLAGL